MPPFERTTAQGLLDVNGYTNGAWYARRGSHVFYTTSLRNMLDGKFPDDLSEEMTSAGIDGPMSDHGSLIANNTEILVWSSHDEAAKKGAEEQTVKAIQSVVGKDIPVRPLSRR